ncbi:MAG: acyltransferase, partial [Clostridiales bacterium]|nr:acyltransferase [Clostridiales bacterium]
MSREKYELRWDTLLEYRGIMFGILAVLIVVYHCCEDMLNGGFCPIFLKPLAMYGNCGVDAFLVLSGIGLYCSYTKEPSTIRFYKKRGLRVVVPYLIIALPYVIWKDIVLNFSITKFLKDWFLITAFTQENRQCWFVALIIIMYFA